MLISSGSSNWPRRSRRVPRTSKMSAKSATKWNESVARIGVELTEGFMMDPEASVSALVFHHPEAKYFKAE